MYLKWHLTDILGVEILIHWVKWIILYTRIDGLFLSNAATTAMMIPIMEVIQTKTQNSSIFLSLLLGSHKWTWLIRPGKENDAFEVKYSNIYSSHVVRVLIWMRLKTDLLCSICYAANIGGTGTIIGNVLKVNMPF